MPSTQETGGNQTSACTHDAAAKINEGFVSELSTYNNNTRENENVKHDDMSLKATMVSINGGAGTSEKPSRARRTWWRETCVILGVLTVILLVALVAVVIMYIRELDDDSRGGSDKICLEDDCISRAAAILGFMNRSVQPCEDFYSFACGGWQAKTYIPTTETQVHILYNINKENKQFMRNFLADPTTRKKYSSNRAVVKTIDFYHSCLSKASINAQGDAYLKHVVAALGGANLTTPKWNASNYDVQKAMVTAFIEFGVQPFFSLNVHADFSNSSLRRFAISEGGIVLSSTFYVAENSTQDFYEKTRSSYRQYMIDVMVLFGADLEEAEQQMEQVYQLEKQIAKVFKENTGNPHASSIDQLSNYTRFDWYSLLTAVTADQDYNLTRDENLMVRTRDVMKGVTALINGTDKAILSNYMAWVAIEDVIFHLPDDYFEVYLAYQKRIYGQKYDAKERWDICYEATKKAFPMPIGLLFVDEKFDAGAKTRASEIFDEIRSEFLLELADQTWMDDSTRAAARKKAEAATILVGYPDYIKNEEELNAEYEAIKVNKSEYLKTVYAAKKFGFAKLIGDYKKPVDRNAFRQSPADINAFHYPQENKNIFLAGILRSPFYDDRNLRASNYGGIGMVAGHELTHGFDINGRLFDKNGNYRNWWTQNSTVAFIRKSNCFIQQYGEFEMFGKKLNGKQTLGENTADNGGLKFAHAAYKRWVARNGEEQKLPGLEYTPYQLFFISYAQGWCSKYTLEGAFHQIDNQPWPPMKLRVEGAIMNSEGFAEAFQCHKGSPMNPEKKCSVW